jgi:hypothetical protein
MNPAKERGTRLRDSGIRLGCGDCLFRVGLILGAFRGNWLETSRIHEGKWQRSNLGLLLVFLKRGVMLLEGENLLNRGRQGDDECDMTRLEQRVPCIIHLHGIMA